MRILLIHNYYQLRGGEDVYVDSLYKLLKENGHEVLLYAKYSSDIKDSLISKTKIAIGMFYNKTTIKELTQIVKSFQPQVAHFHNIYPLITPVAYESCKKLHVPIVQTIHSYRFMCPKATLFRDGKICEECVGKRFFYPSIKYGCYRKSRLQSAVFSLAAYYHDIKRQIKLLDKFIFPAKFTRDYFIKNLPIPLNKTVIIPPFVSDIKVKENKTLKNYFLYVGRLAEEKGVIQLVKLFSQISSFKLLVIGEGPLREKILSYTRFKNIVIYPFNTREVVFGYMKNALATIIPSTFYEVGPMVLIESYANGTPVIVPNFGVFKERVIDGVTGVTYNLDNFNSLKDKINFISQNERVIINMKIKALLEYQNKYTEKIHLERLMKVYNNIIKKQS